MADIIEIISQPPEIAVIEAFAESVVTVSGPPSQTNVILARYTFDTPRLEWIIEHGKGTDFLMVILKNQDSRRLYAPMQIISTNTIKIVFTYPTAGSADIIFSFGNVPNTIYE